MTNVRCSTVVTHVTSLPAYPPSAQISASPGKRVTRVLRACLKRSRSRCEPPHHQVDHGDSDPRLRGLRQGLKVFTEPPRAIEPAEGTFHDPAPLHDLKSLGVPRAFHNDEGPLQHRRDPRDELAGVPPIGPDQCQSRKAGDEGPESLSEKVTLSLRAAAPSGGSWRF